MIGNLSFIQRNILDPVTDAFFKARLHSELGILILPFMEIEGRIAILYALMYLSLGRTYPDAWARACGTPNNRKCENN